MRDSITTYTIRIRNKADLESVQKSIHDESPGQAAMQRQ